MATWTGIAAYLVWGAFGIFAILQATRVNKIKNPIVLVLLFILGPLGFLYSYFSKPSPNEGKLSGRGKLYDEAGNLMFEGNWGSSKYSGKGKYYEAGNLMFEGNFVEGKLSGQGKRYWKNGNLMFEGNFVEGKASGQGKAYYENGKLRHEGNYVDDNASGHGNRYDENGNLM